MDLVTLRPIISGAIGAAISLLLMRRWAKTLPQVYASKPVEQITAENRMAVSVGNALFFLGLVIAVALYQFGGYDSKDWFPLAVGFGFAGVMPLVAIPLVAILTGRSPMEAFAAFSIGQGVPMWATYGSLAILAFLAVFSAVRMLV